MSRAVQLKEVVAARAKASYEKNVGRPKSNQELGSIKKTNTNKELGKIAGVSDE